MVHICEKGLVPRCNAGGINPKDKVTIFFYSGVQYSVVMATATAWVVFVTSYCSNSVTEMVLGGTGLLRFVYF